MVISRPADKQRVLHIISGDLWAGAEAQAATLLKHLKPLCDVSAILLNEGELAERLRAYDIPVTILNEQTLSTWQIFLQLRKHIKQLKPDVIHTHRQKEHIVGALANNTTVKARCVRTVHGAPEFSGGFKTQLLRAFDSWVGNHLQDVIIAVSSELKTKLSTTYPATKIQVVMNGVDVEELKQQAGIADFRTADPHKIHIGIIGRLVPVKRVDIFLETAALFKIEGKTNYHFHVVGDGPLERKLKAQAKTLELGPFVTFHGHRSDIPSYINSLDAVVMCSDHEGVPMVALETIALGRNLVATNNLDFLSAFQVEVNSTRPNQTPESIYNVLKTIKAERLYNYRISDAKTCANSTNELYRL